MKKVKVQYLQIADDAKNAFHLVDKALQAAKTAELGNKQMAVRGCVSSAHRCENKIPNSDRYRGGEAITLRTDARQRSSSEEGRGPATESVQAAIQSSA